MHVFFFKQETAYELRMSEWSADVCSSDLRLALEAVGGKQAIRIDGMTLPARRDGEGRLSMPLLPTDMVVTPQRDAMAIEVEEYGKTDCLRRVEAPKEIRSDERRVGKESVSTCRSRWSTYQ